MRDGPERRCWEELGSGCRRALVLMQGGAWRVGVQEDPVSWYREELGGSGCRRALAPGQGGTRVRGPGAPRELDWELQGGSGCRRVPALGQADPGS